MKPGIFFLIPALFFSSYGFGQGGASKSSFNAEEIAKKNSEEMKERLHLDDQQYKKVVKINLDAAHEMKNTFDNAMGDRDAMRAAMLKVNDATNKKLKEVLTEDQWTEYGVMQEERRQRMRQRQGPN
jgi:hypothetical protein